MLLWRAVRLDEKRVNAEIQELVRPNGLVPTEIASRNEQLPKLRAKLEQIHKRLEWLRSSVDVWVNHAAEHRYVIDEVANLRHGAVANDEDDVARQATEINEASERIDALIAAEIARIAPVAQQTTTASPAPVVAIGSSGYVEIEKAEPKKDEPPPLTTNDIAFCFAGLRWNEQQWKKPLGDKRKWLAACIATAGVRGVSQTLWNPVLIGAALISEGHAKQNNIRGRFQAQPQLKPWLEAWKTYEDDNFSTEFNSVITPGVNPGKR